MVDHQEKTAFIWSIADLLRGDYKQSEYGRVVLPFTVLRRLDCIQSTTKDQVLVRPKMIPETADPEMREQALKSGPLLERSDWPSPRFMGRQSTISSPIRMPSLSLTVTQG